MDGKPEFVSGADSADCMQARGESGANVNQFKLVVPMTPFLLAVSVICAAAVIGLIVTLYGLSQVRMNERLNAYTIDNLETGRIAHLQSAVRTESALIQAYGIGKQCRRAK